MFNKSKYASSTNTLYKVKARFLFLSGLFLFILTGCQICVNSAFSPEYNVKPLNEHHDILPMPLNKLFIYVACLLLQLQKEIWRNAENVFISMYDFFILSIFIICWMKFNQRFHVISFSETTTQSFWQVLCIIARKYLDCESSRQLDNYFKRFEIELKN